MKNVIHLPNDILVDIIKLYSNTYIKCKKDINETHKLIFCKKIHLLYNTLHHICKCNILYIKDINTKICSHHNNVSLDLVNSVINQLNCICNKYNTNIVKTDIFDTDIFNTDIFNNYIDNTNIGNTNTVNTDPVHIHIDIDTDIDTDADIDTDIDTDADIDTDINTNIVNINSSKSYFIHYEGLKKNEFILRFILNKYNYKLLHYCCGGNGCSIGKLYV